MTSTASSDSKLSITSTAISFAESLDSKALSSSTSFNTRAAISSCKFSYKNCDSKSDKFLIISAISA